MKREHQINFWYVIAATLAVIWIQQLLFQPTHIETIPYSEFQQFIDEGKVTDLVIGPDRITGAFALLGYALALWLSFRLVRAVARSGPL